MLFVLGWQHLKLLAFPIAILLLMIPIPAILFNHIVFPLQLLASRVGRCRCPPRASVLREGNIITLANTTSKCRGMQRYPLARLAAHPGHYYGTLPTRVTIRVLVAERDTSLFLPTPWIRLRNGIAAHYYGSAAAEGFFQPLRLFVFVAALRCCSASFDCCSGSRRHACFHPGLRRLHR